MVLCKDKDKVEIGNSVDRRPAMDKTNEAKPKKKGFFVTLKESMTKTSEGCGPGCGCHVEEKAKGNEATEQDEKK
jgi:hypothetical protein